MDVIEGPLLNPKRFEEAFMVSKFGRRLLSFFHPLSRQFSDMKVTETNKKWIRLGTALVTTLLATESGFRYLREDRLFKQLIDCFTELDQYAGQPSIQPFLTRSRMESTLSVGYFDMLGILSKHDTGTKLLIDFRFFTRFYHLSELNSRDDLIRAMIAHFDYSVFLSTSIGFSYLLEADYIDREMDEWFYERNLQYVVQIELYLDGIFGQSSQENRSLDQVFRTQNSPPHFYGEITKTEGGCNLLREKGHFYEFARFIEEHAEESFDQEILLKLKSVLWAVPIRAFVLDMFDIQLDQNLLSKIRQTEHLLNRVSTPLPRLKGISQKQRYDKGSDYSTEDPTGRPTHSRLTSSDQGQPPRTNLNDPSTQPLPLVANTKQIGFQTRTE
ncbi:hypothetical protein QFC22_001979 [Naganishia vaughanmartiniae]|uniref:Uncharacterized protein n=1 Tax=Naganishia vaughanmartiniae TaxID=1424756 RepID=A0ACC2XGM8_9TREE|nr:hypothetical protein QFC22_001979 [Naganishia vaughanmartiniae]